jgi:hypothetical protein
MRPNLTISICLGAMILISATSMADAARSRRSAAECDAYARNYARDQSRQGQILGATGLGSLGGFALGSIWAASGIGAAIGAGVGLVAGILFRTDDAGQIYNVAYRECLSGQRLR